MKHLQLDMKVGTKTTKSWTLSPNNEYIIGRSQESANLCIEHSSLSRTHAKISVSANGSAVIQDLDSKNGTFIDGKQINSNQIVLLRAGTQLQLGDHPQSFVISETLVEPEKEKESSENKKTAKKREKSRSRSHSHEKTKEKLQEGYKNKFENKYNKYDKNNSGRKDKNYKEKTYEKDLSVQKSNINSKKSLLWNKQIETKPATSNLNNLTLQSLDANFNEKLKFLKLMGVKSDQNLRELLPEEKPKDKDEKLTEGVKTIINKQEHMKEDLEKQFNAGLQRKDGRKVGLGFAD